MGNISNTKIEKRAISALQNIIDKHLTMDYYFNTQNNEMSWDGYIYLYENNNGENSKENFDARIPVQIKGHNENLSQFANKKKIGWSVQLSDLKVYYQDYGVLYFQIFTSEDGLCSEIFYASLYPSKIKYYLDMAKKTKIKKKLL